MFEGSTERDKRILTVLARRANSNGDVGYSFTSQHWISEFTNISRTAVVKSLQSLISAGLIAEYIPDSCGRNSHIRLDMARVSKLGIETKRPRRIGVPNFFEIVERMIETC